MQNRNFKRTASFLLVLMMVLTLIPFSAFTEKAVEPVNILIRIEGKDKAIVEYQKMEVVPYDLSYIADIGKNKKINESEKPLAIHAIVKALENANVDVKDPEVFKLNNFGGEYFISDIGEDKAQDKSGWMYKVNGESPSIGVGSYELKENDVIELYYVPDYTNYYSTEFKASKNLVEVREEVTFTFTAKKEEWDKENPIEPVKDGKVLVKEDSKEHTTDEKGQVKISFEKPGIYYVLADKKLEEGSIVRPKPIKIEVKEAVEDKDNSEIYKAIDDAANWILKQEKISDWQAMDLARARKEVPEEYIKEFEKDIKDKKGQFRNVTDYCKMSIVASSLGWDATDLVGYNFIEKIYNNEKMMNQGFNALIYSLLALDSKGYKVPEDAKWTRENLIKELLAGQKEDGGFSLTKDSDSDVDMTAMTLQALSNYQDKEEVKAATEKALDYLSKNQEKDGGYISKWSGDSSESVSQVIIALTSLDIDPAKDEKFIKEDGNLVEKLFSFQAKDGGFEHLKGQGTNEIATEQALRALVSYERFLKNKNKLYDMTDVKVVENPKIEEKPFDDMDKASKWAAPYIEKAKKYELMEGVGNNLFEPRKNMTRAQFATLLVRLLDYEPSNDAKQVFKDVKPNDWYYGFVMKAYEEEIIKGKGKTIFAPNDPITREEMAVMLDRIMPIKEKAEKQNIKDIDKVSNWAKDSVNLVYKMDIMTGSNGKFNPKGKVTREMAATVIVRIYEID